MLTGRVFRILLIFLLLITTNGCKNQANKELIVGVSPDYPPFAFEYRNELIGFDIDLVTAISERLGYKISFKRMDFDELLPALENKTVDLIASSVTKTPERAKKFDFSDSYYKPSFALVFKKEKLGVIKQLNDLSGKIGVERATTMEEYLDNFVNGVVIYDNQKDANNNQSKNDVEVSKIGFFAASSINPESNKEMIIEEKNKAIKTEKDANFDIKTYDKHTDLLTALKKEEIDAVFMEVLEAEVIVQNDRNLSYIQTPNQKDCDCDYGLVFQKGSKLTDKFNKILNDIDSEGKIDILKLRWFSGYGIYSEILKN